MISYRKYIYVIDSVAIRCKGIGNEIYRGAYFQDFKTMLSSASVLFSNYYVIVIFIFYCDFRSGFTRWRPEITDGVSRCSIQPQAVIGVKTIERIFSQAYRRIRKQGIESP